MSTAADASIVKPTHAPPYRPIVHPPVSQHARSPLRSLQVGRGLAALMVVLFHLNNSVWSIPKYFDQPFSPLLSFGNAGVNFFFVLSGFIIYLVHAADIGAPDRLAAFAWRRFVRVYPVYWIVLFGFIAMLLLEPYLGTAGERRLGNFLASALLIPYPLEPILSVAWTLTHEIMFYAMFAIAIVSARTGVLLFAIWQMACLANTLFGTPQFPYGVVFSSYNLLFAFGLIAAYLFKTRQCSRPGLVALGGIAAFLAIGVHQAFAVAPVAKDAHVIGYGFASAVILLGACTYERTHGLRAPKLLDTIGDASYSIYLLHLPLLSLFAKALFASRLAAVLPQTLSLILLLAAVAAAGIAFSKNVEIPLIAMLNRRGSRRLTTKPQPA
jgi:peptidoglycan/LPS O-acetylase OafA/YrhL